MVIKNLIVVLLSFLTLTNVVGQDLPQTSNQEEIGVLSLKLCGYYSSDALELVDKTRNAIKVHIEAHEGIENPTFKQMVEFLNKNKHYMVCGEEAKNYMMVSFENGIAYDKLFNEFFLKELVIDRENYIDINAISYTGPNDIPETVLDYMIRICNSGQISDSKRFEVERLIGIFTKSLGAKNIANYQKQRSRSF